MPKDEKERRVWKIVIAHKTGARSLVESFRKLKWKRNSMATVRSFLCLTATLGILAVTSVQSQKPPDDCQDIQKHIKKEQDRFKAPPPSGSTSCY